MAMYQAPRHIKIDGAMGVTRSPLRCIPPGCPAAVDVLSMITFPWVKQARLVMDNCSARAWVDDLTWWGRGEPDTLCAAVSAVEHLVLTLRDEYDLLANHVKSCVVGHNHKMTQLLAGRESALGLPAKRSFKDLGVAQGTGTESRHMVQKRWDTAVQRMTRIGRLAFDFQGRGKFQATSAMAAGTYGAGAGPTTAVTAAWLRRWAVHSVWRGGRNVGVGLLFPPTYSTGERTRLGTWWLRLGSSSGRP